LAIAKLPNPNKMDATNSSLKIVPIIKVAKPAITVNAIKRGNINRILFFIFSLI